MSRYKYNYAYFPILIDKDLLGISRDELYDELKKYNVFTRKYFFPLVTDFGCYKDNYNDCDIPVAKKISSRILCLPLYYDLSFEDIDYICDCITELLSKRIIK